MGTKPLVCTIEFGINAIYSTFGTPQWSAFIICLDNKIEMILREILFAIPASCHFWHKFAKKKKETSRAIKGKTPRCESETLSLQKLGQLRKT